MAEPTAALYEWHDHQLRHLKFPRGSASLDQILLGLPAGTYEALRTRGQARFFRLDRHIARGAQGCKASGFPMLDESAFRAGIDGAARHFGIEAKVRIDFLPRPVEELGMRTSTLFSFQELMLPSDATYAQGVGVYPTQDLERPSPVVKGTAFIAARAARQPVNEDDFEPILLDCDGNCLEGSMSNFFSFQGGSLHTAGTGVLHGITRETLLECARSLGFSVIEKAVHQTQVPLATEAFLCSSVRGILPVVRFAGKTIGKGLPGPRTKALSDAYGELVCATAKAALGDN